MTSKKILVLVIWVKLLMFACLLFNFLKLLMKAFKNCDFNWGGNSCKIYRERRLKGWIYLLDHFVSFVWPFFFHYVSFHWQVLFPLLENVQKLSSTASNVKDEAATGNILIHHSRDTAEKQWAETCVLSLAGVARTFNAKRKVLQTIGKTTVVKDISIVAGFGYCWISILVSQNLRPVANYTCFRY